MTMIAATTGEPNPRRSPSPSQRRRRLEQRRRQARPQSPPPSPRRLLAVASRWKSSSRFLVPRSGRVNARLMPVESRTLCRPHYHAQLIPRLWSKKNLNCLFSSQRLSGLRRLRTRTSQANQVVQRSQANGVMQVRLRVSRGGRNGSRCRQTMKIRTRAQRERRGKGEPSKPTTQYQSGLCHHSVTWRSTKRLNR